MKEPKAITTVILRDTAGRLVCRIPCDDFKSLAQMQERCEYKGHEYKYVGFQDSAATFIEIDEA